MTLRLVNFSVVVAADRHNPSILNPDFLARYGIIRDDWDWKVAGSPVSTPPLSRVLYDQGVSLVCEPAKLQVSHEGLSVDVSQSRVPEIVSNYVQHLPVVRYTGMGVNFTAAAENDHPSRYLIDRFLALGPWDDQANPLRDASLAFVYEYEGARLRISLDSGEVRIGEQEEAPRPAVILRANFHHELPREEAVSRIAALSERSPAYWAYVSSLSDKLLQQVHQ